jgi:hypothetical protein
MLQRCVTVILTKLYTFYTPFTTRQELDVCGQVHIPAVLPRGGDPPHPPSTVSVEVVAGWALD